MVEFTALENPYEASSSIDISFTTSPYFNPLDIAETLLHKLTTALYFSIIILS